MWGCMLWRKQQYLDAHCSSRPYCLPLLSDSQYRTLPTNLLTYSTLRTAASCRHHNEAAAVPVPRQAAPEPWWLAGPYHFRVQELRQLQGQS